MDDTPNTTSPAVFPGTSANANGTVATAGSYNANANSTVAAADANANANGTVAAANTNVAIANGTAAAANARANGTVATAGYNTNLANANGTVATGYSANANGTVATGYSANANGTATGYSANGVPTVAGSYSANANANGAYATATGINADGTSVPTLRVQLVLQSINTLPNGTEELSFNAVALSRDLADPTNRATPAAYLKLTASGEDLVGRYTVNDVFDVNFTWVSSVTVPAVPPVPLVQPVAPWLTNVPPGTPVPDIIAPDPTLVREGPDPSLMPGVPTPEVTWGPGHTPGPNETLLPPNNMPVPSDPVGTVASDGTFVPSASTNDPVLGPNFTPAVDSVLVPPTTVPDPALGSVPAPAPYAPVPNSREPDLTSVTPLSDSVPNATGFGTTSVIPAVFPASDTSAPDVGAELTSVETEEAKIEAEIAKLDAEINKPKGS